MLDLNVRDGLVYYRALKANRGRLDALRQRSCRPLGRLGAAQRADRLLAQRLQRDRAEDCRRPLSDPARSTDYPARSIRQIPGAFERLTHRVGGPDGDAGSDRADRFLPAFEDPRAFFALGRGAIGSGRLRSEAYHGGDARTAIDRGRRRMRRPAPSASMSIASATRSRVSSIFSWRAEGVHGSLRRQGAGAVRHPQPDRACRSRVRLSRGC